MRAEPATLSPGQPVSITLSLTNTGPGEVSGVSLTTFLPPALPYEAAWGPPAATYDPRLRMLIWQAGGLAMDQVLDLGYRARVADQASTGSLALAAQAQIPGVPGTLVASTTLMLQPPIQPAPEPLPARSPAGPPALVSVMVQPPLLYPGQQARVLVFVADAQGRAVADGRQMGVEAAGGSLSSAQADTRDGLIRLTLTAGGQAGAGQVVARAGDVSGAAPFRVGAPGSVRVGEETGAAAFDPAAAVQQVRNRLRSTAAGRWQAENGRYAATFDANGLELSLKEDDAQEQAALEAAGGARLSFRLLEIRAGGQTLYRTQGNPLSPLAVDNEARYRRTPGLVESYRALNDGVQQLFTLEARPAYGGDPSPRSGQALVIRGRLDTALQPVLVSAAEGLLFYLPGTARERLGQDVGVLRYTGALVRDAGGRQAVAGLALQGKDLLLTVPGDWLAEAEYPVVVDPMIGDPKLVSDPRAMQGELAIAYANPAGGTGNPDDDLYLVVWLDERAGDVGVYGQLVAASGGLSGANFPIYNGTGDNYKPGVAYSGQAGEFLVAWSLGNARIYGQRLSGTGALLDNPDTPGDESQPGTAFSISSQTSNQREPEVAAGDATGSYLVAWADYGQGNIYGQIISPTGSLSGSNVVIGSGGENEDPDVAYDARTQAYLVVWEEASSDNIYGQLVSPGGGVWGTRLEVCAEARNQGEPEVAANASGGGYLAAWRDERAGSKNIYGRRVSGSGALEGAVFPIAPITGGKLYPWAAFNAASREYLIVWEDYRNGDADIYGQRMTEAGDLAGNNFRISDAGAAGDQLSPQVAAAGAAGYAVAWEDQRSDSLGDIYGQVIDTGGVLSGANFVVAATGQEQDAPALAYAGPGEAGPGFYLVVWRDKRSGQSEIYGQEISPGGVLSGSHFIVSEGASDGAPGLAYNENADEFLVAWTRWWPSDSDDIYGQRLARSGVQLDNLDTPANEAEAGVAFPICIQPADQSNVRVAAQASSGAYLVAWMDERNESSLDDDLYGQAIAASGALAGSELALASAPDDQAWPSLAALAEGRGFFSAWLDQRSGSHDLYGQRLSAAGIPLGNHEDLGNIGPIYGLASASHTEAPGVLLAWATWPGEIYAQRYVPLVADFSAEPLTGTLPLTVTFTHLSTPVEIISGVTWSYGDGVTGHTLALTHTHTYTQAGVYSVSLSAGDGVVTDTLTRTAYVTVSSMADEPIAGLSATNDSPTGLGQATTLMATVTAGGNVSYAWAFGDGDTGNGAQVTHTYPATGSYTAVVTASNSVSVMTATTAVTVTGTPALTITKAGPATAAAGEPITYTLVVTNVGGASASNLVITDAIPSGAGYLSGGTRVGDVVSWTFSLLPNTASIQFSFVVTATGTITNRDYRVTAGGDPSAGSGQAISATGQVAVVTVVTPAPMADFSAAPLTGAAPLTVSFSDRSSGNPTAWEWDFGDGATSDQQNPVHTYSMPGSYTVTLGVTNTVGTNTMTKADYVVITDTPLAITFMEVQSGASSASSSVTTSANLTGVGGDLYVAAISSKPYVVVSGVVGLGLSWSPLRAQCAGRNQTGIQVWLAQGTPTGNGPVTATFSGTPSNAVIAVSRYSGVALANPVGNLVSGNTNGVEGACSGGIDSSTYAFDLNTTLDGAVVYGAVAIRQTSHTPGAGYTERVEVSKGSGSSVAGLAVEDQTFATASLVTVDGTTSSSVDWAVVALEIKPGSSGPVSAGPLADFSAAPLTGSVPLTVTFTNLSTPTHVITSALWSYGDGAIGNTLALTHTHTYTQAGVYTVTLSVSDGVATDTLTRTRYITTSQPLVAGFSAAPLTGSVPLTVTFTDLSSGWIDSHVWDYGDGITSTTSTLTHTHIYTQAGVYSVTLTVSGPIGSDTLTRASYITGNASPAAGEFPWSPILDDFNRSDGPLGSNWAGMTSGYSIAGHRLDVGSGQYIFWDAAAFGAEQEVYITLVAIDPAGGEMSLVLKRQASSNSLLEVLYDPAGHLVQVWTYSDAQGWLQQGANLGATFAAGDRLGARARPDGRVEIYRNDTLLGTRDVSGWPYYAEGGQIGLWFVDAGETLLDDFGGGTASVEPVAGVSATPLAGSVPLTVTFTDQSSGWIDSHLWAYGDGITSTISTFTHTHTYTQAGVYTVTLAVSDGVVSDTLTRTNYTPNGLNLDFWLDSGIVGFSIPNSCEVHCDQDRIHPRGN